ncbi:MAG: hypothetical protein QXJ66_07950, partial [Candidatus Methanomethylicia archaeon]
FKRDLYKKILNEGYATVLTHPEYFWKSIGICDGNVYLVKIFNLILTFLRIKTLNKIYEKFLLEHKGKFQFLKYIELYERIVR